jgi:hypothetical protein
MKGFLNKSSLRMRLKNLIPHKDYLKMSLTVKTLYGGWRVSVVESVHSMCKALGSTQKATKKITWASEGPMPMPMYVHPYNM